MTQRWMTRLYAGTGWLFVGCLLVQIFLAGIGVFDRASGFGAHVNFGYLFGWLTLIMLAIALVGRLPRRLVALALALLVLFALQSLLVALRGSAPMVAALHPLNGVAILLIGVVAARGSTRLARASALPTLGSGERVKAAPSVR